MIYRNTRPSWKNHICIHCNELRNKRGVGVKNCAQAGEPSLLINHIIVVPKVLNQFYDEKHWFWRRVLKKFDISALTPPWEKIWQNFRVSRRNRQKIIKIIKSCPRAYEGLIEDLLNLNETTGKCIDINAHFSEV